ncbi:hypothetical protein [Amycolatopsis sp. NPDC021455]|uniref:hypothetical protein n=1 Tax=Amycolatopsis sp. NPDC021455 TaxID=3154901 RepID=UPI0033E3B82B
MTDTPEINIIRVGDSENRGGLYNMLIPGGFERAAALLPLIDIDPETGPAFRLRDAWLEIAPLVASGIVVHVYTRIGGNNRPDYENEIEQLRGKPTYLRDADDSFDSTYASFYFGLPTEHAAAWRDVAQDPIDTGKRWRTFLAALKG